MKYKVEATTRKMPKKQARNAFWYFMLDWKNRQEALGRSFPNGFRDVQADPECNAAWRALSDQQKIPYTTRAKQGKMEMNRDKKTGTGESVQKIKEEQQREVDFKLNMDAHIRHTVFNAKKYGAVPGLKFLFLHMNWYYMREPDNGPVDFCPAEFTIAEFSLENGVTDYYHEIINTDLHLGYTREALETSEKTHKLHWHLPIGEGDWRVIYQKFIDFVTPRMTNDKIPPIYTSKKIVHIIPSLLRRMTGAVGRDPDMFLIYTIESLFANMLRAVSEFADSNVLAVLAETQFTKELFAYTPNIECDYHKTLDGTSQFCSLSVVRQWGFTFCDNCCQHLKIDMIPGVHCPESSTIIMHAKSFTGSMRSLCSDQSPSVLSATGVSEAHRIRVSERSRDEERSRRNAAASIKLEIIDHSQLPEDERLQKPVPETVFAAIAAAPPMKPLRAPRTVCQALIGKSREAPLFNCANFPIIGGRGMPIKTEEPRQQPQVPIWTHRGRKDSDSD